MSENGFVQVGFTAMRDPMTGEFMEPVPLFIREEDRDVANEEKLINDLARTLAAQIRNGIIKNIDGRDFGKWVAKDTEED